MSDMRISGSCPEVVGAKANPVSFLTASRNESRLELVSIGLVVLPEETTHARNCKVGISLFSIRRLKLMKLRRRQRLLK